MQFTVPQFIEEEVKIFGPFTFRQFIYVGSGFFICIVLYFSMAQKNLFLFILLAFVIMLLSGMLAFFKVGGRPLTTVLKNFFFFFVAQKLFLWKRKQISPIITKKVIKKEEKPEAEETTLKLSEKSQLRSLSKQIIQNSNS